MKKLILVLFSLFLVGCSSYNKTVDSAEVIISESRIFDEEEILNAVEVVKKDMRDLPKFVDVEKIKYDEEKFLLEWVSSEKDVIIIYTDYYANDHHEVETGIQPDHQYVDWKYILVRDSDGNWNIDDKGYG